jgi:hypothetical protein
LLRTTTTMLGSAPAAASVDVAVAAATAEIQRQQILSERQIDRNRPPYILEVMSLKWGPLPNNAPEDYIPQPRVNECQVYWTETGQVSTYHYEQLRPSFKFMDHPTANQLYVTLSEHIVQKLRRHGVHLRIHDGRYRQGFDVPLSDSVDRLNRVIEGGSSVDILSRVTISLTIANLPANAKRNNSSFTYTLQASVRSDTGKQWVLAKTNAYQHIQTFQKGDVTKQPYCSFDSILPHILATKDSRFFLI